MTTRVEAGQIFVGHDQQAVFVGIEFFLDIFGGKSVDDVFGIFNAIHHTLSGKSDDGLERLVFDGITDGEKVPDRRFDVAGYHHGPGLAFQFFRPRHLFQEMAGDDVGIDGDGFLMPFHVGPELFLRLGAVEQRIFPDEFFDLVVTLVARRCS